MTPEELKQIFEWLEKNPRVEAELRDTSDPLEKELWLTRTNSFNETEYVIIGIPLMLRPSKNKKMN